MIFYSVLRTLQTMCTKTRKTDTYKGIPYFHPFELLIHNYLKLSALACLLRAEKIKFYHIELIGDWARSIVNLNPTWGIILRQILPISFKIKTQSELTLYLQLYCLCHESTWQYIRIFTFLPSVFFQTEMRELNSNKVPCFFNQLTFCMKQSLSFKSWATFFWQHEKLQLHGSSQASPHS